jgi:CheY-like chemotaxis protein
VTDTTTSAQETILVVEDEVIARMVISEYLRHCGYKVVEAANADEALTILKHTEVNIDVVFTVVQLPGYCRRIWSGDVDTQEPSHSRRDINGYYPRSR